MSSVELGWSDGPEERHERVSLIRAAWHAAYRHIFSRREIDDIFDGELEGHGSWLANRLTPAGTLAARRDRRLLGLASLGLLRNGDGELAAFYVWPEEQGRGVGSALWRASIAELAGRGCRRMQIWTLVGTAAQGFYEAHSCVTIGDATFTVGAHTVPAVGYALDLSGVEPATLSLRPPS